MIKVLTNLNIDDHFANPLCLAVLAKFASGHCKVESVDKSQPKRQSSPSDENRSEWPDIFLPARKFFSARRAPKTLDLAVIKAITVCSQSCQFSSREMVESLRLSGEIVDAFQSHEKCAWLSKNIGKMKKLHEKISRPGIDLNVQCEVCRSKLGTFYHLIEI